MKSKVKFSTFCTLMTWLVSGLLIAAIATACVSQDRPAIGLAIAVAVFGSVLWYCPLSIEARADALVIHRPLRNKVIPWKGISSAERCLPSAAGIRVCGSGGYFGYWGYFSDIIIGSYFGYYGNRNQCILVKLKNGRQYVISCQDPDGMADAIETRIS